LNNKRTSFGIIQAVLVARVGHATHSKEEKKAKQKEEKRRLAREPDTPHPIPIPRD